MSNTKRKSLITCAIAAIMQLTGCAKNVQWEEEVLLNTGETIVVTKEVRYTMADKAAQRYMRAPETAAHSKSRPALHKPRSWAQ